MSPRAPVRVKLTALVFAVAALGSACAGNAPRTSAPEGPAAPENPAPVTEPYRPHLDPADFGGPIDNPYFPLLPGTVLEYRGTSEGQQETDVVTVTDRTREIMGITATVVRDEVSVDGELTELTFDWYAQDSAGNVWYLGEDSAEYEHGKVTSRAGSWEAGVDGAQPGIIMLAHPEAGVSYRQEFYAGEAEDQARVLQTDGTVSVPAGDYDRVLVTEDSTPLEPNLLEHKLYAPGVGTVLERSVHGPSEILRLVRVTG